MNDRNPRRSPIVASDLVLYKSPAGAVKVGVLVRDETIWLTQQALSELFAVGVSAIAKHLKNVFDSGELAPKAVVSILETTGPDGKCPSWGHRASVTVNAAKTVAMSQIESHLAQRDKGLLPTTQQTRRQAP